MDERWKPHSTLNGVFERMIDGYANDDKWMIKYSFGKLKLEDDPFQSFIMTAFWKSSALNSL